MAERRLHYMAMIGDQMVWKLERQLVYTISLVIITLLFTCGKRKICSTITESQKIMSMTVCKISVCFLCIYWQTELSKQIISYFDWNLLYLSKKHPRPNLEGFQYQIQTSLKQSGKQLSNKTNFSAFLQINWVKSQRVTSIFKQKNLRKSGSSQKRITASTDNYLQSI